MQVNGAQTVRVDATGAVVHSRLLTCLQNVYHVPEYLLCVLNSYLSCRSHAVRVDGSMSTTRDVLSGVIQGSVLGPLLFIAYVNATCNMSTSPGSNIIMYADDLCYLRPLNCPEAEDWLRQDVEAIYKSFNSISLSLNLSKTKYMLLTLSPQPVHLSSPLSLNGNCIERVSTFKYLGVVVDARLSFSDHTRNVVAKGRRALGCVSRTIRKFVPCSIIRRIFVTVVLPSVLYASPISYPVFKKDMLRLERFNKYACRLICNNFSFNTNYASLLSKARIRPIYHTTYVNRLCLLYKYVNGIRFLPQELIIYETNNTRVRRSVRNVTNNRQLVIPFVDRERCQKSFIIIGSKLWNCLSDDVLSLEYNKFRRKVNKSDVLQLLCDRNVLEILVV